MPKAKTSGADERKAPEPVIVPLTLLHRALEQLDTRLDDKPEDTYGGLFSFEGGYVRIERADAPDELTLHALPPGRAEDPDVDWLRDADGTAYHRLTMPRGELRTRGLTWLGLLWQSCPSVWHENGHLHPETQRRIDGDMARYATEDAAEDAAEGRDRSPRADAAGRAGLGDMLDGLGRALRKRTEARKKLCAELLAEERKRIDEIVAQRATDEP